jgi:hypothetical protein
VRYATLTWLPRKSVALIAATSRHVARARVGHGTGDDRIADR